MARIPDDELERLKREVSIEGLARARGVELKRIGRDLRGQCPFHSPDDDPSLCIDPERNVFHCFGCSAKGSVIDWVMQAEGVSFLHAVEILRADNPDLSSSPDRPPPKRSRVQKLPDLVAKKAGDGELRTRVALYYHETLKKHPEPVEYLSRRGLDPERIVDRFKLGFSNRTLGYHIPQSQWRNGKAIRTRLQELGIIKGSGHELMRGSLTIPIFDTAGEVVQIYGRKIGQGLRKGVPLHLYLPGPRRGVWNLAALAEAKEVILCEALIDALTFYSAGFPNVTSAWGVNGFTDEHLEALAAYGIERVLIAYDRDDAGDQAALELGKRLAAEGISSFRVRFPRGMDANDYALKVTPATQSLGVLLRAAEHLAGPVKTTMAMPTPETAVEPPERAQTGKPARRSEAPPDAEPASPLAAKSSPPPPASPVPPTPAADVAAEVRDHEVVITFGDRRWRVRGLARNLSFEQLRINLLVAKGESFHVDSLDLYSARQRVIFLKAAVEELQVKHEVLKRDLGRVLLKLEQLQEEQIRKTLEPEHQEVTLSEQERTAAMRLLQDSMLLDRVSADLTTCGLVGEHTNKLVAYLAAVSRKLDRPLAVMVQSSSAAGKSALMEAVLALVPDEDRVQYSAMTGQSLFYMGETDLAHKVLAIAEEEGAERASYALKLLQSEGKLSIASTGKDPKSGRLVTHEYHVQGPAAIMLTTTAIDLDEELLNRCIVLAVDESREQTRAIHRLQREVRTLEGLEHRMARQDTLSLHQNAQRLLRPLFVVNPYAKQLTFLDDTTRTRRDHEKYLALIDAVALLHQHQRKVLSGTVCGRQVHYVEVTLDDIALANRLAAEALGRTLDELPPQTRRFLVLLYEWVSTQCEDKEVEQSAFRFSRRQVLDTTGWSYPQVRRHLERLVAHEYVLVHLGGRGRSFVYELLWDGGGKDGEPFVMGLIDIDRLRTASPTTTALTPSERGLTPSEQNLDPSLTPHLPPDDPPLTPADSRSNSSSSKGYERGSSEGARKRISGLPTQAAVVAAAASYAQAD